MLAGNAAARREQAEIDTLEIERGQIPHAVGLAAETHRLAHRPLAGKRNQLADGEPTFLQDLEHGLANEAGGTDDGYAIGILAGHRIRYSESKRRLGSDSGAPRRIGIYAGTASPGRRRAAGQGRGRPASTAGVTGWTSAFWARWRR